MQNPLTMPKTPSLQQEHKMAKEALKDQFKNAKFKKAMAKRDECIAKGMKPDEADEEFEKAFGEDDEVPEEGVEKALKEVADLIKGQSPEAFKQLVQQAVDAEKGKHESQLEEWRKSFYESFKVMAGRQNEMFKGLTAAMDVIDSLRKAIESNTDLVKSLKPATGADALAKGGAVGGDVNPAALDAAANPQAATQPKAALDTPADMAANAASGALTHEGFISKGMERLQKGDLGAADAQDIGKAISLANMGVPVSELKAEYGQLLGL